MIVAIDGPCGVGKTSVAKAVAQKVGFCCLDTGAMYRAVAYLALKESLDLTDDEALGLLARSAEISFGHEAGDPIPKRVFVNGEEITSQIRTYEIDRAVSPVSAAPSVREALVSLQQRIGAQGNYVIEGRDIGTVVFPRAEVKVYLTASAQERACRRVGQNKERGVGSLDYDEVLADLERRDHADMTRSVGPLRQAEDAHLIDSTNMTIEEVIESICKLIEGVKECQ